MNIRSLSAFLLILFSLAASRPAYGQPVRGMVWTPPEQQLVAEADLSLMKQAGVEAVRTPLLRNPALYRLADSLGLVLYQDLPFSYMPTAELRDTIQYAAQVIQEALWWAEQYTSARYFGLVRYGDTSDPEVCPLLEHLAALVRQGTVAGAKVYYSTHFVESDQCVDVVDQVLMHPREETDPLELIQRWRKAHALPSGRMGLDALGTWVNSERDNGFRVPHSPIYQARYLESHLNTLLYEAPTADQPAVVFVNRWRDQLLGYPSPAHDLHYPFRQSYGLMSLDGGIRLALGVVRGLYTDQQRVFAFAAGQDPGEQPAWPILLGWGVIGLLAFGTTRASRFHMMMRRYFSAHGFYREAVREGREMLLRVNGMILVSLMVAVGILGSVLLESVRQQEAFILLVRWLPGTARSTLVALLDQPVAMVFVLGSAFAIGITLWTSFLAALSTRNRRRLLPGQVFMLVLWPRWPLLLLMVAAMVISTVPAGQVVPFAMALLLVTVVISLAASARTLLDYAAITRASMLQVFIAAVTNPLFLLIACCTYIALQHTSRVQFLLHLLFRS